MPRKEPLATFSRLLITSVRSGRPGCTMTTSLILLYAAAAPLSCASCECEDVRVDSRAGCQVPRRTSGLANQVGFESRLMLHNPGV